MLRRFATIIRVTAVLAASLMLGVKAMAASAVSFSFAVTPNSGVRLTGTSDFEVRFFAAETGGVALDAVVRSFPKTAVTNGVFELSVVLPAAGLALLDQGGALFVEVTELPKHTVYPRQQVHAVPHALRVPVDPGTFSYDANGALTIGSVTGDAVSISQKLKDQGVPIEEDQMPAIGGDLSGTYGAVAVTKIQGNAFTLTGANVNDALAWNGTQWAAYTVPNALGGTVSRIDVGPGLSGGPITSGAGTLSLKLAPGGGLSDTLAGNELGVAAGGVTSNHIADGALAATHFAAAAGIDDTKLAVIATAGKVADTALSANVTKLGSDIDLASGEVVAALPESRGGTNASTLTGLVKSDGTSWAAASPGIDYALPNELAAADGNPLHAVVVDASGQVGIGSTTPSALLDVAGTVKFGADAAATCTSAADGGRIRYNANLVEYCNGVTQTWIAMNSQPGKVPTGAIAAFDRSTCPVGWKASDGTAGTVDLRGVAIRGLNDFGTGARADGNQDPDGARVLGSLQQDSMQSHNHTDAGHVHSMPTYLIAAPNGLHIGGAFAGSVGAWTTATGYANLTDPTDSGTGGGTPRHGMDTRGRNIGLIFCERE